MIPPITTRSYHPNEILAIYNETLCNCLIYSFSWAYKYLKIALLLSIILLLLLPSVGKRLFTFVSGFLILLFAVFQNISYTDRHGWCYTPSNSIIMLSMVYTLFKETVSSKSRFDNTAIDWKQLLWFPMMFGCLLVPIDFELQLMNPDPVVSWDRFFVSDTIAAFCYVAPTILGVVSLFFDSVSRELFESLSAGCTVIGIVASINFLKLKGLYAILMHIPLTFYAFYGPYLLYSHQKAKQN